MPSQNMQSAAANLTRGERKVSRVVVGMSGGVDSAVAAGLLQQQGYDVTGVTMKIWGGTPSRIRGTRHACYGPGEQEDIEDASRVAHRLGIPHIVVDLVDEYHDTVLEYVRREYLSGRTPNPCVVCNAHIKLGSLLDKLWENGVEFDFIATGHYARIERSGTNRDYELKKALDTGKDQTYFLCAMPRSLLSHTLFPLGGLKKETVRRVARDLHLEVAQKPESQDFVDGGDYSTLFGQRPDPGQIVDEQGKVLGTHKGIVHYTIGQRRGLGVSAPHPLYVISIDADNNTLVVGPKNKLFSYSLYASAMNWLVEPPDVPIDVHAKIRYSPRETPVRVVPLENGRTYVGFERPQMAVAPGQAVVFYDGETCLGGGLIEICSEDSNQGEQPSRAR